MNSLFRVFNDNYTPALKACAALSDTTTSNAAALTEIPQPYPDSGKNIYCGIEVASFIKKTFTYSAPTAGYGSTDSPKTETTQA